MAIKKGDRVEYTQKGEPKYGVVLRGGAKKIAVVLDGGQLQVSGHPDCFKLSDKPLVVDTVKTPMDKYSVVGYREIRGHDDSQAFEAFIAKDGKKILSAFDSGHGGEVEYQKLWGGNVEEQFHEDAKAWARQFNPDDTGYGAADCWISWYVYQRPFGVTAQAYWDDYKEMLKA